MAEMSEDILKALNCKYTELKHMTKDREVLLECEIHWETSKIKTSFSSLLVDIDNLLESVDCGSCSKYRLYGMKSVLLNWQADLLISFKEQKKAVEVLIDNCKCLLPKSTNDYIIYIYMQTIKAVADVLEDDDELPSLQAILEKSIQIYESAKGRFFSGDDLFSANICIQPNQELITKFDTMFVNILEILKSVYDRQGNKKESLKIRHILLQIQLKTGDGSLIIWLQNLMQLANELIVYEYFQCARHHLAAATFKLETMKNIFAVKNDKPGKEGVKRNSSILEGLEAELASVWIKYGISLFLSSKKKHLELYHSRQKETTSCSKGDNKDDLNIDLEMNEKSHIGECKIECSLLDSEMDLSIGNNDPEIDNLKFRTLDIFNIESSVCCELIESINEAKDMLEFVLSWIAKAGDYFEFVDFPVEYISLMLDLSEVYKCYSFYEPELTERYTIHLKRQSILDSLIRVTNELDETVFIDAHIEIARELAQVRLDLLNSDLHRLRELKSIALGRLQLNTESYQLEQQLRLNAEELENSRNSLSTFQSDNSH